MFPKITSKIFTYPFLDGPDAIAASEARAARSRLASPSHHVARHHIHVHGPPITASGQVNVGQPSKYDTHSLSLLRHQGPY